MAHPKWGNIALLYEWLDEGRFVSFSEMRCITIEEFFEIAGDCTKNSKGLCIVGAASDNPMIKVVK